MWCTWWTRGYWSDVRRARGGRELHRGEWVGCILDDIRASVSTPINGRLQLRTRRNYGRRWNKGQNVSWPNGSPQKRQVLITACSGTPERDRKDQNEDNPNQACLCWFSSVYPSGLCLLIYVMLSSLALHLLSCFNFVPLPVLMARPSVQSFFGMHAPCQPNAVSQQLLSRVFFPLYFLSLLFVEVAFSGYFVPSVLYRFLFVWRVRYTFFFWIVVFYTATTGWSLTSYVGAQKET